MTKSPWVKKQNYPFLSCEILLIFCFFHLDQSDDTLVESSQPSESKVNGRPMVKKMKKSASTSKFASNISASSQSNSQGLNARIEETEEG